MPNTGWTSSTLPTKLRGADSRLMGTPNLGWIPTRTNNNPLSGPYVSHQMRCSPENEVQITTEVQELLYKGAILGDTTNTTELCVSNFFWYKNEWGSETSDKPKGSQSISEDRTLQDRRSSFTPRQAWGNYTMQVINCNCNYLDLNENAIAITITVFISKAFN